MTNLHDLKIAVDFDGTCVLHRYPQVGPDAPHAPYVLKKLVEHGAKLILWTMRSGEHLDDAIMWFNNHGIELYGIQCDPIQHQWTKSPKAFANLYIDDAAFGCPLIDPVPGQGDRPFVDWQVVHQKLFGA